MARVALTDDNGALYGAPATWLNGKFAGKAEAHASVIDQLTTALDTRDPRPLVVAQASDSTGDTAAEWFEITWKELLAEKWPDRPARVNRWDKATDVYSPTETWQTASTPGAPGPVTLARDTFSTDRSPVNGTADESGHTWSVSGPALAVSGGYLRQPTAGVSYASIPLGTHDGINGTTTMSFKIVSTGSTQQVYIVHTSSASSTGNRLQLLIGGSGGSTPVLQQIVDGTTTSLATFPSGLLAWATEITVNASVTVEGSAVTATINGATVNATVDPAVFGKSFTYFAVNNAQGVQIDSFERTGTATTTAINSPLGYFTAYNGAYAGGTLQHNIARLDAMYPVAPDVLFINHGHNYTGVTTPDLLAQAFVDFVNIFHAKWPGVPVVVFSQNPKFPVEGARTEAQAEEHQARQRRLRALCREQGWGYIPGLEAYMALADKGKSLINADGVHPLTGAQAGTGSRLQADTAKAWISEQSLRP